MANGGPGVQTADNSIKNPRPVTAKGQFVKTGEPGVASGTGKSKEFMEVTDLGEVERSSTPSPTKTQGSEVR